VTVFSGRLRLFLLSSAEFEELALIAFRKMRIGLVNRKSTSSGFTLLELIVVVAVLGILVAIAIQQFAIFRSRAVDTTMRSDLKNAALAMESYYGEFLEYPATVNVIQLFGYRKSSGITLTITVPSPSIFTLNAAMPNGTQPSFTFDSSTGLIN
jgi:type IV pilus assembly protein PilA